MTDAQRVQHITNGKPFNRADIIVYTVLAVVVALVMILVFGGGSGEYVTVTTGSGSKTYPLSKNAVINVESHLTVIIEDGKVCVRDADCPDKICERSGKISRSGSMIACLPNGIVITVTKESKDDLIDVGMKCPLSSARYLISGRADI